VSTLIDWLNFNGFDNLFVDLHSIGAGDRWRDALMRAAASCRVVLCVVSQNWLSSHECFDEFLAASAACKFALAARCTLSDLNLKADIPAPAGVLCKTSGLDGSIDWAAVPKPIPVFQVDHRILVELNGPGGGKRNPAKALASAPTRASVCGIPVCGELFADRLHRITVQPQHGAATRRELNQVEGGWPWFVVSLGRLLNFTAVIPNTVRLAGERIQMLARGCVFDAIAICKDHTANIIGLLKKI